MTFKKGETLIFYDQPVTFIEYYGQESSKIRFEKNSEELVSTNIVGETYVSTRLLRKEPTTPFLLLQDLNYYVSTTLKFSKSFMDRFFPDSKKELCNIFFGDSVKVVFKDCEALVKIDDFFEWFDARGNSKTV